MYRRAAPPRISSRPNGEQVQQTTSPKRSSRRTHNPFRNNYDRTTRPSFPLVIVTCASVCCVLPLLIGYVTLHQGGNVRRNATTATPRTFENDEWFAPKKQRAVHERERITIARRTITHGSPRIFVQEDDRWDASSSSGDDDKPQLMGPIGRDPEEDEVTDDDYAKWEFSGILDYENDGYMHVNSHYLEDEEENDEECVYKEEWQTQNYLSCNCMHEINMMPTTDSFVFIACGGDRCAFRFTGVDNTDAVLKTSRFQRALGQGILEMNRRDAGIMGRLTSSPYVVDIYSSCGVSQVVEYGANGNIHDLVKVARESGEDKMSNIDKLRICYQIAQAVTDMHAANVAHNDICCHQFIFVDGVYKLNDFNLGAFVKYHGDKACFNRVTDIGENLYKLRAPEEHGDAWYKGRFIDLRQVDVYMMGSIFYYVLTKQWLFEDFWMHEAEELIMSGHRSPMPKDLMESDDPSVVSIRRAIEFCWFHDPFERPTSQEVSKYLLWELKNILNVTDVGIVRVSIPPLPPGFRHTDSDFTDNLAMWYDDDAYNEEQWLTAMNLTEDRYAHPHRGDAHIYVSDVAALVDEYNESYVHQANYLQEHQNDDFLWE